MNYRFGNFQLNTRSAQLSGPDGPITLRPMTLRLLEALIENAPDLQTHEQLLQRVWGRQEVSVGVVAQSIRELRRALGETTEQPIYIETRHRLGYRFVAPVERIDPADSDHERARSRAPRVIDSAATAGAIADTATTATAPNYRPAVLAILITFAGALLWLLWPERQQGNSEEARQLARFRVVADDRPTDPEAAAAYMTALRARESGDLHHAGSALQAVLAREPQSIAAAVALADVFALSGDVAKAREWATRASAQADTLPGAERLRVRGFSAGLDNRWRDAERHLQAVFALQPGDAESGFRLFEAQLVLGQSDAAITTLQALSQLASPQVDRSRLELAHARIAALQGDQSARLAAAQRAEAASSPSPAQVMAVLEQAGAQLLLGERAAASDLLTRAEALQTASAWPEGAIRIAMLQATLAHETSQYDLALQHLDDAHAKAHTLSQGVLAGAIRRERAYVLYLAGRLPEARAGLSEVEQEFARMGHQRELASTLEVLALIEQKVGAMDAARSAMERALAIYQQSDDVVGEASVRSNLGMHFARSGRLEEAGIEIEKALALFRASGNRRGAAIALGNQAAILARTGRAEAAREANEAALGEFKAMGATRDAARVQFNLGLQDRRAGALAEAEVRIREALAGFTEISAGDMQLQAAASLAMLRLERVDLQDAGAVLAAQPTTSSPQPVAALASARARLALLQGDLATAEREFGKARDLRERAGLKDWVLASTLDLAEVAVRSGALAEAEQTALNIRRSLLAAGDITATQAGFLLVCLRSSRGERSASLIEELTGEVSRLGDAGMQRRLDMLVAAQQDEQSSEALLAVAGTARAQGFDLLALRAEQLAGGAAAESSIRQLGTAGIVSSGLPKRWACG